MLDVHSEILGPRCALSGCHTGTGAPFGLDLSSVTSASVRLIEVPSSEVPTYLRVDPGNPTDSYLYMKLVGDPRILGDPMPAAGGGLNAAELTLIHDWIANGAP